METLYLININTINAAISKVRENAYPTLYAKVKEFRSLSWKEQIKFQFSSSDTHIMI